MGLIRYGIKALIRNRGRTIGIAIGVIIAITLISGTNIATDSLISYEVQKVLDDVVVDLRVTSTVDEPDQIMTILQTVKEEYDIIEDAFPFTYSSGHNDLILNASGSIYWPSINASGFNPNNFINHSMMVGLDYEILQNSRLQGFINITEGSFPNSNTNILLDEITAARYNVSVGANLSVGVFSTVYSGTGMSYTTTNYTRDITNLTIAGLFAIQSYSHLQALVGYPVEYNQTIIFTNFTIMHAMLDFFLPDTEYMGLKFPTTYNLLIDHASIDVIDLATSKSQLKKISNAIHSKGGISFDFAMQENLYTTITLEEGMINNIRMMLLVVSLPALIIGLYLTMTLYNQTLERRIVEIGQLKSKGATKRQIASWFLFEASILGGIGGIIGYFGGFATSYIFLMANLQTEFPNFMSANLLHGSLFSLLFALALGVITCVLSVVGPIQRLNKLAVVDATKKQLNYKVYNPWKSKYDIPALILGAFPIVWMLIFSDQVIHMLPSEIRNIFLFISQTLTSVTFVAPFLLAYGIIKVLSGRSPSRFSKIAQKLATLVSRKNAHLIGRNIGGRPKQSGGLVFILALTICLGIVVSTIQTSQQAYMRDSTYVQVGADIQIRPSFSLCLNDSLLLKNDIAKFSPDIERVTPTATVSGYSRGSSTGSYTSFGGSGDDTSYTLVQVCGINATEYPDVVRFRPDFVPSGDPDATFSKLADTLNGTLLLESWATESGYKEGDTFVVKSPSGSSVSLKITGFFNLMPGADYPISVINFEFLRNNFTSFSSFIPATLLVKMIPQPSMNGTQLAKNIKDAFASRIVDINSLEEELANSGRYGFESVLNVLDIEYAFIVLIATAGVAIIVYRSFSERQRDIATLRARGMSFGDLLKLQGGEGTTLVLFGLLLGLVGIPIAYTLNMQFGLTYGYGYTTIPRPFVLPLSLIWQLGLTFLILVAVVWIISWREVKRTKIPEIADILRIY